jgi:hypothetical protein
MNWIALAVGSRAGPSSQYFHTRKNFAVRWQLEWANPFSSRSVQSPGRASQVTLRDEGGSKNFSGKGNFSPLLMATQPQAPINLCDPPGITMLADEKPIVYSGSAAFTFRESFDGSVFCVCIHARQRMESTECGKQGKYRVALSGVSCIAPAPSHYLPFSPERRRRGRRKFGRSAK